MNARNSDPELKVNTTILIPTYNRPKELKRLLTFLELLDNPYPIVVLDGSIHDNQKINKEIASTFKNVVHPDFEPNSHMGIRLSVGLNEYVSTEYTIFCGDDDFVVPAGIRQGETFLNMNHEFNAVNGLVLCLAHPKKYSHYGLFSFINHLKNPLILDQPTFLARILKHDAITDIGCPPLFYALRRTDKARIIFDKVPSHLKYSSQEMLTNALTLLTGKSTTIPYLMNFRDYSSETTRDIIREDLIFGISTEDAHYIRDALRSEMSKSQTFYSDEVINFILDQYIPLPLKKVSDRFIEIDMKTSLAKKIETKKHWPFYLLYYFLPSLYEKFDRTVDKKTMIALKRSFKAS